MWAAGTLPLPSTHRTVPSKSRIGKTRNRFRHRPLAQAKGFCCATKQAALRNGIPVSDPKKTGILIVLLHNLQDKSSASRSWKSKSNRGSFVSIFWFQLPTTDDYRLTTNDPPLFSIFKDQLKAPSEFQFCQGHSFQIPTIGKMTCKRGDTITSTPIIISKINLKNLRISAKALPLQASTINQGLGFPVMPFAETARMLFTT